MSNIKRDFKVVLFDLDGTLLDSREFLVQSSYDILQENYPNKFTYKDIESDFGNGFGRLLPDRESKIGVIALEKFQEVKLEQYHETLYFPGVIEGLHHLHDQGIQLGIVTNQNKQVATNSLNHHNIDELFDVMIALDDVKEGKPSPEGIIQALEQLQCQKEEVVMIGDSRFDIIAGDRAGVMTGFMTWYENLEIPTETPSDFTFKDFNSLLETVLAKQPYKKKHIHSGGVQR